MFNLSNIKNKNLLQNHSAHVYSINFKRIPREMKAQIDDFDKIAELPCIRGPQDQRALYVNKACAEWQDLIRYFVALDSLPDIILHDMHKNYQQKYKHLTADKLSTFNEEETIKRTIYALLLEVMWSHGNDVIRSVMCHCPNTLTRRKERSSQVVTMAEAGRTSSTISQNHLTILFL